MRSARDEIGAETSLSQWQEVMDSYSAQKAAALCSTFVANGTWYVPTLSVFSALVFRTADAPPDEARRRYLAPLVLEIFDDQYKGYGRLRAVRL